MMVSLIAAAAENNAIGKDNGMLWYLPADLRYFKQTTKGHHIIMGRKTFESFGKPLPDRTHVLITRQKDYRQPGCTIVHGLEAALQLARENGETEAFVIGGGEIYRQALPFADRIYLTRVHATFKEADAWFPERDPTVWKAVKEERHEADAKHEYAFDFLVYERIRQPAG